MTGAFRILALIGAMAFVVAVVLTVTDIALRSVSGLTVYGLVDIVQLCVMFGAILAIPYGFVADEHVTIDVFTTRLPAEFQRALRIFAAILGVVFLGGVCWFSAKQMLLEAGYGDRSQSIGIPMIWYWLPLVVGIGLSVIANIWLIVHLLRRRGRG